MKIAIITESFLPQVNGVTNTVTRIVRRLIETGHQPLVIAPGPGPSSYEGCPVVRVRSVAMPRYRTFRVGLPDPEVERALARFRPDVVHLASPIALGAVGLAAARRQGLPVVAVFQTDIAGFARQYGVGAGTVVDRWVGRLHRRCDRTLVPSGASFAHLDALGVGDLHYWRRGVDGELFRPGRREDRLRRTWSPDPSHPIVGYVGRLAHEKEVHRLREIADLPGISLVIVGDGPARASLERVLPGARFTGMLHGPPLAAAYASLDVFVHTGTTETFCQTVQEAQASGVAVVAPAAGGPLDLVDHDHTGLLFDPTTPQALRDAVASLTRDQIRRRRLSSAAGAAVAGRSWARVVDELTDEHYPAVIGGPAAAAA
ncbi:MULTISPECIES: glycosyltransferase family 4 protein [Gordonia]|uniref:glycosyltransferase family 4 protein n=1 Tax=Gordonia TaxID=2053 RepID=UPI001BCF74AC|nr:MULTISPECIES: glycosyltransferase family 1 protein [Gordonia]